MSSSVDFMLLALREMEQKGVEFVDGSFKPETSCRTNASKWAIKKISPKYFIKSLSDASRRNQIDLDSEVGIQNFCQLDTYLTQFPMKKKRFQAELLEITGENYETYRERKIQKIQDKNLLKRTKKIEMAFKAERNEMMWDRIASNRMTSFKCQIQNRPDTIGLYLDEIQREKPWPEDSEIWSELLRFENYGTPFSAETHNAIMKVIDSKKIQTLEAGSSWKREETTENFKKGIAATKTAFEKFIQIPSGQEFKQTYESLLACENAPIGKSK